jgi:hypothetical protein
MLERRLEIIKAFIANGYTANTETGIVYSYSRKYGSNELKQRGCIDKRNGYIQLCTKVNGSGLRLLGHHLVYYLATGKVVEELDHINRNKTDNRIDNLREVTRTENMCNKSNVKGYSKRSDNGKWRAEIQVNGIKINLGNYNTEEQAKQVYLEAKEQYHIIGNVDQVLENIKNKPRKEPRVKIKKEPKGYSYRKDNNKWRAEITVNHKKINLGTFIKEEDARNAYLEAREKLS